MDLSKNGSINGLSFSSWLELILGVSQNSVLGPILFNVYISALFYLTELTDFCNCADDTTFHPCDSNLEDVIGRLEHNSMLAIKWFESNYMKFNQDKCHFVIWSQAWSNVCKNRKPKNFGKLSAKTLRNYHWSKFEIWQIHSDTIRKSWKKT